MQSNDHWRIQWNIELNEGNLVIIDVEWHGPELKAVDPAILAILFGLEIVITFLNQAAHRHTVHLRHALHMHSVKFRA
jgi:hypothetical protein